MLSALVKDVLVDLVGNREDVELDAQVANQFQFRPREYLASRIVRRIENDRFRVLVEGAAQFFLVECPLAAVDRRWTELHKLRLRATENRVGPVILVEGLEDDYFIARVAHRKQR